MEGKTQETAAAMGRYECAVSTEMTAGTRAVGDETGAQMAHPARSL